MCFGSGLAITVSRWRWRGGPPDIMNQGNRGARKANCAEGKPCGRETHPGGAPGLQIRREALDASGGFDSHSFPPYRPLRRVRVHSLPCRSTVSESKLII